MRILVIEDEVQLADAVSEILKRNKYFVDTVYDGADGLDYALTGVYDCILLDVMLPKMNGFEVLSNLRKEKISTAVIMLTAKSEVEDKITGLDGGADDYITKPFNTSELLARIRATTRRKGEFVDDNCISFGNLKLMKNSCSIAYGENDIKLSLKEFQIMEAFMNHPSQIISAERLMEKIWGFDSDSEINVVWTYISYLRKKLKLLQSGVTIKAVRNIGYTLENENA